MPAGEKAALRFTYAHEGHGWSLFEFAVGGRRHQIDGCSDIAYPWNGFVQAGLGLLAQGRPVEVVFDHEGSVTKLLFASIFEGDEVGANGCAVIALTYDYAQQLREVQFVETGLEPEAVARALFEMVERAIDEAASEYHRPQFDLDAMQRLRTALR
jgi:hypothetical protein